VTGFLSRLLGRAEAQAPSTRVEADLFQGHETLEVVGESNYQEALWQVVGGFRRTPVRESCVALLVPEPTNAHDRNAVRVLIQGLLVGYLSREDAAAYLPGLQRLIAGCDTGRVALEGVICGGGQRDHGVGFLGVFLDHNPVDFGVAPHHTTGGTLRTGLSEAIATDLADDTYDLSWLGTLGQDGETAVAQLRALLIDEREPIDRHYMFCELESRLYHRRTVDPAALARFDEVCEQHHEEMTVIRPAIVGKFKCVPVIEMYRQAAIRWQKVKEWEAAREWARRGLEVYGLEVARPEAVADLEKRVAHATNKLEPLPMPARPTKTKRAAATIVETLICGGCGQPFERQRARGRKPKLCPTCRDLSAPAVIQ
jgi:hypothetical protein